MFSYRCNYTELAPSTSQYYFALQSLHTASPSTTLYYNKACTKHVPVQLLTRQLAPSTSQHYFVLQSLHKAFPHQGMSHATFMQPLLCASQSKIPTHHVTAMCRHARNICNIHADIKLHFAAAGGEPACLCAHETEHEHH